MKKPIAAAAIAATTLGGVAAGATVLGPGLAGAQDDSETAPVDMFADRVSEALQPLVDDGTITELQRDAVVQQLEVSRPERGEFGFGHHRHRLAAGADLAEILGMEPEEMADALRGGETLADLAEANGVDTQDLVDAIVAAVEERVNTAVENDRIDEEQAAEIVENAAERAEDVVSGEVPLGGPRGHGPGHHGFGPEGSDFPADTGDDAAEA